MNAPQRTLVAVFAFLLCVAATTWAVRGLHQPTGNVGMLGTDVAGVEGVGAGPNPAVSGVSADGSRGLLGTPTGGVYGSNGAGDAYTYIGRPNSGVEVTALCTDCSGVISFANQNATIAVRGITSAAPGKTGVRGDSEAGFGVAGYTLNGTGVFGQIDSGGGGHAGWFNGRVHVNGTLSKSAGTFRIDHPLDPANRYLSHSFVESPDMKNIYDGVVTLEAGGTAVVELPKWFDALNENFRYQLTCIGGHADVYIAEKIEDNRFRIAGGYEGLEVSWQVTGSRKDLYALAHPVIVEEMKAPQEVGRYLHPELYGYPQTMQIGYRPERAIRR